MAILFLSAAEIMAMACASPVEAGGPKVSAVMSRILAPLIAECDLDGGHIEIEQTRGMCAVEIEIDPGDSTGGWVLYIRSDTQRFLPGGAGKPGSDLMWKLDEEDSHSYKRLTDYEAVVMENPEGGRVHIMLDFLIALDWRTDPGTYGIELLFRTAYL